LSNNVRGNSQYDNLDDDNIKNKNYDAKYDAKYDTKYDNDYTTPEYIYDSSRIHTNNDWVYPEKCLSDQLCKNNYYNASNYSNGYYDFNDNYNYINDLSCPPKKSIHSNDKMNNKLNKKSILKKYKSKK